MVTEPRTEEAEPLDSAVSATWHAAKARIGQVAGGSYRISRHLGSGGSSHVFEAEHLRLGKTFALKLLRAELDGGGRASQRFRREAKAVARLHSEHIVSVVDCGELDDQTPYLVMERLQGEDLRSLLNREGALPVRRALQLGIEACRGLAVVHQAGLVHRDLKPENLFITRRAAGEDWCKILDFGVAKMEASLSTAEGAIIGTARYMAPEQLNDSAAIGPATDLYAVGAILYECLSGRPAHAGETIQKVMFRVMHTEPDALSASCPTLPKSVCDIIERCLAKTPADRPQAAAELEAELSAALERPRESSESHTLAEEALTPRPVASRRATRDLWSAPALLFAALAALAGAAAASAWPRRALVSTAPVVSAQSVRAQTRLPNAPTLPSSAAETKPTSISSLSNTPTPPPTPAPLMAPAPRRSSPRVASSAPKPAVTAAPRAPVGNFDQANPYGE
jgi:serine/threonine protein kinase